MSAVNSKKLLFVNGKLSNLIQYTIEQNCCSQDNSKHIQTIENNFSPPSCSDYPDHPKLLGELNTGADSTHRYRQKRHHLCSQCKLIFSFISMQRVHSPPPHLSQRCKFNKSVICRVYISGFFLNFKL